MFDEDQLLPLSALQHLLFCERQCALIHLEGLWAENRLTVEGSHLHRRAHEETREWQGNPRVARGLPLRSLRLGLVGKADVVELEPGDPPYRRVYPIEYKRGKAKRGLEDRVQLCAQALCLEEMLQVAVPAGALFYGLTRRRLEVQFDPPLRDRTEAAAVRLHRMIADGVTPLAVRQPKCDSCSLLELCMPDAMRPRRAAGAWVRAALARAVEPASGEESPR